VAQALNAAGIGTLLMDLTTADSQREGFDLARLVGRLNGAIAWVHEQQGLQDVPIGLFGGSTGAAVALAVAADPGSGVSAVVCRGGRCDLAERYLPSVTAPTLLIVGADDAPVLEVNRRSQPRLAGPARLEVVPGAGHLFEEPGAMEHVISLTVTWITSQLLRGRSTRDAGPASD
jgi:putative phosphoribosyl transferase